MNKQSKRRLKIWLLVVFPAVLLLAAAGYAWSVHREHKQSVALLAEARALLAEGDERNAYILVRRVLQISPSSVDAFRVAAEISEAKNPKNALAWRSRVAAAEPEVAANLLDLADAALAAGDVKTARNALEKLSEKERSSARYHATSARLALAENLEDEAKSHFEKALQIEPDNADLQFQLSQLLIRSPKAAERERARNSLHQLGEDERYRRGALRLLIVERGEDGDARGALALARDLAGVNSATFGDRLLLLDLLRKTRNREFTSYLATLKDEAAADEKLLAVLVDWMNQAGLPLLAIQWSQYLPEEIRRKPPAVFSLAQSHGDAGDWDGLHGYVDAGDWGSMEFLRRAFLARALDAEDLPTASQEQMNLAAKAAAKSPAFLSHLASLLRRWGWGSRADEILWALAGDEGAAESVLQVLYRRYRDANDTSGLLRVSLRMLDANPEFTAAKNNVAYFSLLRDKGSALGHRYAREVYEQDRTNPAFASTYALSLYFQGSAKDGLAVLDAFPEEQKREPSFAVCYGVLLAADPATVNRAGAYLSAAQDRRLLPEERALVMEALEKATREDKTKTKQY